MENESTKTVETNDVNNDTNNPGADTKDLEKRIKELEAENGKLRQANTNASADASKWKKQYQEKLTEEEKAKAQQEEAATAMQKELEALRAERNVANDKSQFLSIGFEDALAQEVSEALNAGDKAKLFDGIRRFIESHDKALREQSLRNNPVIRGGVAKPVMSKEEFEKMGYKDRVKLFNEDRDLYNEMTK